MPDRDFWLTVRQALLLVVDAIEKRWHFDVTSDMRAWAKRHGWGSND